MSILNNIQPPMEIRRPLTYPLKKNDQIFFMHIPKTAGTTLVELIRQQFKPEEYFSHTGRLPECLTPEVMKPIETARFVRAHQPYNFQQYFPRHPVIITMLREPIARTYSNYVHLRTYGQDRLSEMGKELGKTDGELISIEEFLTLKTQSNRQTRYLAGLPFSDNSMSPKSMLLLAKTHLESMAFFGITERFDDSLRLLTYTFGWNLPTKYESLNRSTAKREMTPELETAIRNANELDIELYNYATQLFDFRYKQMLKELKQQGKSL